MKDTLVNSVAKQIKDLIINSGYKPGDKLPNEQNLGELFGVSRLTIRESMKILKAENIVLIKQGSGTYVSPMLGLGNDPLGLQFVKKDTLIDELFECRQMIEPQIVELVIRRATQTDLDELEKILLEMDNLKYENAEFLRLDIEFHKKLAECTHNEVLTRFVPIIIRSIYESFSSDIKDPIRSSHTKQDHKRIYESILNADLIGAKFYMEEHIKKSKERGKALWQRR